MKTKIVLVLLAAVLFAGSYYFTYTIQSQQKANNKQVTELNNQISGWRKLQEESAKIQKDTVKSSGTDLLGQLDNLNLAQYQAVHLTDKNVYFGKIVEYNSNFVVLKDIYYISGGYADPAQPNGAQAQISLVKRGSELHAPEDSMTINTANILYVETLKADGQVAKAIQADKTVRY